jgi:hypothetical protein
MAVCASTAETACQGWGLYLQVVSVFALVAHFSGLFFQMTFALARFFLDGKLFNFKSALHVFLPFRVAL